MNTADFYKLMKSVLSNDQFEFDDKNQKIYVKSKAFLDYDIKKAVEDTLSEPARLSSELVILRGGGVGAHRFKIDNHHIRVDNQTIKINELGEISLGETIDEEFKNTVDELHNKIVVNGAITFKNKNGEAISKVIILKNSGIKMTIADVIWGDKRNRTSQFNKHIVNNLNTQNSMKALSAAMGMKIWDRVNALTAEKNALGRSLQLDIKSTKSELKKDIVDTNIKTLDDVKMTEDSLIDTISGVKDDITASINELLSDIANTKDLARTKITQINNQIENAKKDVVKKIEPKLIKMSATKLKNGE